MGGQGDQRGRRQIAIDMCALGPNLTRFSVSAALRRERETLFATSRPSTHTDSGANFRFDLIRECCNAGLLHSRS